MRAVKRHAGAALMLGLLLPGVALAAAHDTLDMGTAVAVDQLDEYRGGTEVVNTHIRNLLATRAPRKKIITSTVEHNATSELAKQLARDGYEIVMIEVNREGELDLGQLIAAVDDDTALVSMMWANNETGVIFPIEQIVAMPNDTGSCSCAQIRSCSRRTAASMSAREPNPHGARSR